MPKKKAPTLEDMGNAPAAQPFNPAAFTPPTAPAKPTKGFTPKRGKKIAPRPKGTK